MAGKVLLVISGEEREPLREPLSNAGFSVCCATSAADAIERCAGNGSFDLLVADVSLDMGGTINAVAEHLRAKYPTISVLFLSTCPLNWLLDRGALNAEQFAGHSTAFLRRPVPDTVLMGKIWGLVEHNGVSLDAGRAPVVEAVAVAANPVRKPVRSESPRHERRQQMQRAGRARGATFAAGA